MFIEAVDSVVDCKRRRSILRKLRRRRIEEKLFAEQHLTEEKHSLSMTSSLQVPSPSEDNILSPGSQDKIEENTQEVHLPKGDVRSKDVGNIQVSSQKGVISKDIPHVVTSDDTATGVILSDVAKGGISDEATKDGISGDAAHGLIPDDYKAGGVISDDVTKGVIFIDSTRDGISDDPKAKSEVPDDISVQVLSDDITPVVPGTDIPYSRYADVVGERLSQGTSVVARRRLGDLGINNETLRVLRVNPKLTIDTGKCR